jgi:tRNA A-37 threonylcarbamoyl transferase component Bud32
LVTEEIPAAQTLTTYLRQNDAFSPDLLRRLAEIIGRLHAAGLSHRDLKLTNILLDDELHPWLIDLDGLRQYEPLTDRRAHADLLRFAQALVRYPKAREQIPAFVANYCEVRGNNHDPASLTASLQQALPELGPVRHE